MTVSATTPKITYVYTGLGDYTFTFKIYKPRDITVYHLDTVGHANLLVLNTDYEVIQTEGVQGGVCRIINVLPAGGYIAIERKLLVTQETDWVNNDPFNAEQLEDDLDRMVMILQEFNRDLTAAAVYVAWKGAWVTGTDYRERDMVSGPDLNIYTCMIAHTSSYSFSNDVANGNWALMIPVGDMEDTLDQAIAARDAAIAAASDAAASAQEAYDSAIAAAAAANEAEASSIVAINAELNAANCSVEAHDSAIDSHLGALESYHWANMPEDAPVPESMAPPEYSSYHWSKKAEGIVGGGITALTGVPPVLVTGSASSKTIDLDKTDRVFVPSGGTHDQALMVHAGVPIWKTPPYPVPPDQLMYGVHNVIDNPEFRLRAAPALPFSGDSIWPVVGRWFATDSTTLGGAVPPEINLLDYAGESCLKFTGHELIAPFEIWQRTATPLHYKDKKVAIHVRVNTTNIQNMTISLAVVPASGLQFDVYDSGPIALPTGFSDIDLVTPELDYLGHTFNNYTSENLRLKLSFDDTHVVTLRVFKVQLVISDAVTPYRPKSRAADELNCLAHFFKSQNETMPMIADGRDIRRTYYTLNPPMRVSPEVTELSATNCTGTLTSTRERVYAEYVATAATSIATIRYECQAEYLKGN